MAGEKSGFALAYLAERVAGPFLRDVVAIDVGDPFEFTLCKSIVLYIGMYIYYWNSLLLYCF